MTPLTDDIDCVESTAPGARWFVWRAPNGRVHVMRTTKRKRRPMAEGTVHPVPPKALELCLRELGAKKPETMNWLPTTITKPRTIIARLPKSIAQQMGEST